MQMAVLSAEETLDPRSASNVISAPRRPVTHPLQFAGPGAYASALPGSGCGVVFEDDGQAGYLYVTNETHTYVFDTLLLYDRGSHNQLFPGEHAAIVWNQKQKRAGLFYHHAFQAAVDFANRRAICRTGAGAHAWDDELIEGLE
jgi:hypothetical protein